MSWSVSASGKPSEVRGQLSEQFKGPLAEKPAGLSDDGERETVQKVHELLEDWDKKTGCYQSVNVAVSY